MSTTYEQATLTAPDISCGHCVAAIKQSIGALIGVRRVEASASTKQVEVTFDPKQVSLDRIETALDEAGYPVRK